MREIGIGVAALLWTACTGTMGGPEQGAGGAASTSSASGSMTTTSGSMGGSTSSNGGGSTGGSGGMGVAGAGGMGPDPCEPIAGVSYSSLSTEGPKTDRSPPKHPDLNLKIRGWEIAGGTTLGLVDIAGPTDDKAPRLNTIFSDDQVPGFATNYAVYQWDWQQSKKGGLITDWEVTLTGMKTVPGQILELAKSGYDIGGGKQARVLFADEDSITLKYTREDNVVKGYTIHMVGLCVEPSLKALYDAKDAAGRNELPALAGNEPVGRARTTEIKVTIRDTGAFMAPRSKKDWW